jgi:hypothetical protein
MTPTDLTRQPPQVINVGIADFADALHAQGADVVDVRWTPPHEIDPEMQQLLERLL